MTQIRRGQIYCQRCSAPNALGQDSCARCGTRLMLVVEPTASRFEGEGVARGGVEEHLLERISALENHLSRLTDKVLQLAELSLRQSSTNYLDQTLLQSLIGVLSDAGALDRRRLDAAWRTVRESERAEKEARARREELCERIVAAGEGAQGGRFAQLVREGFRLLGEGKTPAGVRELGRALAESPQNAPLNSFLGEHFFRAGRTARALDHLARAHAADPECGRVGLLLGLALSDEGEAARARELLRVAVERVSPSFAAHCALGRLSAAEEDWKGALREFKLALIARPSAVAYFLLGLANFRLERHATALRHLAKAVEADPAYAEAHFLKGFAHLRAGDRERAREAFAAAAVTEAGEARYKAALRGLARGGKLKEPQPLFDPRGKLLGGGDARVAAAVRDDALASASPR